MPFVFYDTETTGKEPKFDQILQFAAIKTDDNLNEIDEFNIRCRLLAYIIPSPGALVKTRVHPRMLVDKMLPSHYAATRAIRAKFLDWSPAVFVGHNSISFDEELLRQGLFKTLHDPYLTNKNGNRRADALRIAHAAHAYSPGSLNIPKTDDGRETFSLEKLAPANGYAHVDAHEALADVRATIHIAKRIKERSSDVWDVMIENCSKQTVVEKMRSMPEFSWTARWGRNFSFLATACGINPKNTGQVAVFDLAYDPSKFFELSVDELVEAINSDNKIIRVVAANKQPILFSPEKAPNDTKATEVDPVERARRSQLIAQNQDFQSRVSIALSLRYADTPKSSYVEELIYDGFANADEPAMERFHRIEWKDRHSITASLQDARLIELGRRLLYVEHPDGMTDEARAERKAWVLTRCTTQEDVPWTTVQRAYAEADEMLVDAGPDDTNLLNDFKDYLSDVQRGFEAG